MDTYGEILASLVDKICKVEDRQDVLRRNEIPKGHYYNVINPNKRTSSDNPFYCPTEWGVKLTRDGRVYNWIKTVAKDCGCVCLTPEDIRSLKNSDAKNAIDIIHDILGVIS